MKGGIYIEPVSPSTIGARLSYLFGAASYGNYPEIQALWDQLNKTIDPQVRQDLTTRIQKLINDKTMYIFTFTPTSPAAVGSRVKGNPFKGPPPIYFVSPMEDIELKDQ